MRDQVLRLILASASPRRAELLARAGFQFETRPVAVDERWRADEPPEQYVRRLAVEKSGAALKELMMTAGGLAEPLHHTVILGADTAVVLDGDVFGKPADDRDAAAMLSRLAGHRHQVMTGVSLRRRALELSHVEISVVEFRPLTEDEIAEYIKSGEGRDKAGAYAIQGAGGQFVTRLEGSYSNVVGLPVTIVCQLIERLRISEQ